MGRVLFFFFFLIGEKKHRQQAHREDDSEAEGTQETDAPDREMFPLLMKEKDHVFAKFPEIPPEQCCSLS